MYKYVIFSELNPPVAQSVEQLPFKERVVGSIPTGRTRLKKWTAPLLSTLVLDGNMFR